MVESLKQIMEENRSVLFFLSNYLNNTPNAVGKDSVQKLSDSCSVSNEEAFLALFTAAMGMDPLENPADKKVEKLYIRPGLHRLSPSEYQNDAYLQTIEFPRITLGNWKLLHGKYLPYQPFVCNHPVVTKEFREIPQIGYFTEEFSYPAVSEGGIEWMTVTPNEIETMKQPIANATGEVLTLGLGLGYFAFHASEKESVKSVTVVERDKQVIRLFQDYILPRFPHGEKIKILEGDALRFMEEELRLHSFDSVFCDLWHDQSDGFDLYIRLKKTEKFAPGARFDYWIEPTLLSVLRRMVAEKITSPEFAAKISDPSLLLSEEELKKLAKNLKIQTE